MSETTVKFQLLATFPPEMNPGMNHEIAQKWYWLGYGISNFGFEIVRRLLCARLKQSFEER